MIVGVDPVPGVIVVIEADCEVNMVVVRWSGVSLVLVVFVTGTTLMVTAVPRDIQMVMLSRISPDVWSESPRSHFLILYRLGCEDL